MYAAHVLAYYIHRFEKTNTGSWQLRRTFFKNQIAAYRKQMEV